MPSGDNNKITSLTEEMERFLDWLCLGEERLQGESQTKFAVRLGVSPNTLLNWKKHPVFRQRWDERMRKTHAAPDLLQDQLIVLQNIANDEDAKPSERIKAIETYWKLLGQNSPDRVEVDDKRSTEQLSDDELESELEAGLAHLRAV